jgi:hypothetical protein
MHLTQVILLPQPHTKLDLETISNQLNDCDIDLSLDESIEDGDIILNFLPEDNTTMDSAYVFTDKSNQYPQPFLKTAMFDAKYL